MNIFLINYILMLIEAAFLIFNPQKNRNLFEDDIKKRKKWFVILVCVQWILISGLRSDNTGADTISYSIMFEKHANLSWQECINYFKAYYLNGSEKYSFEPGYVLFEKLVSSIWKNQLFYKFVVATIFMGSLGRFVYKNSDDPFLAFMLYSGMFYNMFSLTGYRQVLSVAIGVLWAYEYVKQRKFLKFLLLVILAFTLHKTTLVFILFYFLCKKKITSGYTTIAIMGITGMIVLRNPLFNLVKGLVGYDEYGGYQGATLRTFLLLFVVLVILAIWRYPSIIKKCPDAKMYYNGLVLSAAMIPFAMVSPTSLRLVYNFAFMLMLLVPKVFQSFKDNRDKAIAYACSIAVFGFFIATKSVPYEFFWQAM